MNMEKQAQSASGVLDAVRCAVRPVRLSLDGAPVAAHALISGDVEFSANDAVPAAGTALARLEAFGAKLQAQPAKGISRITTKWEDVENLVRSGRLKLQ